MARVLAPQLPSAHLFAARPPRTHRFLLLECELLILLDVGILGLVLELPTALVILCLILFILEIGALLAICQCLEFPMALANPFLVPFFLMALDRKELAMVSVCAMTPMLLMSFATIWVATAPSPPPPCAPRTPATWPTASSTT